tara:strand:+ start:1105 stop:1353 length:249 start_codon:yes stop_codon:yes gene_type:complete
MKLAEIAPKKDMDIIKADPKEITLQDPKTKVKTVVPANMIDTDPDNPGDPNSISVNSDKDTTKKNTLRPGQKVKVNQKDATA